MFTKGTLDCHPLPANATPTPTPLSHHSHLPQPLSLFIPGRGPARFTYVALPAIRLFVARFCARWTREGPKTGFAITLSYHWSNLHCFLQPLASPSASPTFQPLQPLPHKISHTHSDQPRALRGASQRNTFDRISQSQQGSCTAARKSRRTLLEWLGRTGLLPTGSFSSTPPPIQGFCTCNALLSLSRMQFFYCDNSISDCCTASKSPKSSLNLASRGPEQQVDVGSCP
jgi:hypothetical protein